MAAIIAPIRGVELRSTFAAQPNRARIQEAVQAQSRPIPNPSHDPAQTSAGKCTPPLTRERLTSPARAQAAAPTGGAAESPARIAPARYQAREASPLGKEGSRGGGGRRI